jgi:hypothetical protein
MPPKPVPLQSYGGSGAMCADARFAEGEVAERM